jgi:hypothetical protein
MAAITETFYGPSEYVSKILTYIKYREASSEKILYKDV